jgi:hypothetical protein
MQAYFVSHLAESHWIFRRFQTAFVKPPVQAAPGLMQNHPRPNGRQSPQRPSHQSIASMKYLECINSCYTCISACESCAAQGPAEESVGKMIHCLQLLKTCADICTLTAREMARESEFAKDLCAIGAKVCQTCGDECAAHWGEPFHRCAAACHRCAEDCMTVSRCA